MRVLISVDMEGAAGVVDGEDVSRGTGEYERFRLLLTEETNAAVRGALRAVPDADVTVTEAHGSFRNLVPERLDRRALLLRGKPKPYRMMAGLAPFGEYTDPADVVVFLGYHGRAGTRGSVLSHTINGRVVADVRLDGRSVGELGLNIALTCALGAVPILAVGDDTVAREASDLVPGIGTVVVKWALGSRAAALLHPAEAADRIEAAVPEAFARRENVEPLRFEGPVDVEVDVLAPGQLENAELVPGVTVSGPRTVSYAAPDYPTAYRVVQLVALLGST